MGSYRLSYPQKKGRSNVDELQLLIGISADPKFLQQVTYITLTHDPKILQIDTSRAYHSGPVLSRLSHLACFCLVRIIVGADVVGRDY